VRNAEGKLPVDIGIGLNTDNVVSGTIGSKKRMDYTIIGDGVNLAARLESACKQYGAHILISEFTNKLLRGTYYSRELDLVVVKGKTQPVAIYEILDYHTEESYPNMTDAMRHFKAGLQKYRSRNGTTPRANSTRYWRSTTTTRRPRCTSSAATTSSPTRRETTGMASG
jgi:adenylate cyclase